MSNDSYFHNSYCLVTELYSPKQHIAKNRLIRYLFDVFFLALRKISLFSFNLSFISKTWSTLVHIGEIICNSTLVALGVNQNDLQMLTLVLIAKRPWVRTISQQIYCSTSCKNFWYFSQPFKISFSLSTDKVGMTEFWWTTLKVLEVKWINKQKK